VKGPLKRPLFRIAQSEQKVQATNDHHYLSGCDGSYGVRNRCGKGVDSGTKRHS